MSCRFDTTYDKTTTGYYLSPMLFADYRYYRSREMCVCVDYHRGGLYIHCPFFSLPFSSFLFFGGGEEEVSIHWHFPDFHYHFSLEWGAKGANLSPVSIIPFVLMRVLFLLGLFSCPIIPLIVLLCSTLFCHSLLEGPFSPAFIYFGHSCLFDLAKGLKPIQYLALFVELDCLLLFLLAVKDNICSIIIVAIPLIASPRFGITQLPDRNIYNFSTGK